MVSHFAVKLELDKGVNKMAKDEDKKKTPIRDFIEGPDRGKRMTPSQIRNQANVRPIKARKYPIDMGIESHDRRGNPDVDIRGAKGRLVREIKQKAKDDAKGGKNFPKIADSKMMDQVNRRLKKVRRGEGANQNSRMVLSQAHDKDLKKNYRNVSALEKIISVGTAKGKHNALNKALKRRDKDKKLGAPHLKSSEQSSFQRGYSDGVRDASQQIRRKDRASKKQPILDKLSDITGIARGGNTPNRVKRYNTPKKNIDPNARYASGKAKGELDVRKADEGTGTFKVGGPIMDRNYLKGK